MRKTPALTYIFLNPNTPAAFEENLKKVLLEKLLAEFPYPECISEVWSAVRTYRAD